MSMVIACLTSLPRLRAEESFLAEQRVAMGTGSYELDTRQQIHRAWARQAALPRLRRVKSDRTTFVWRDSAEARKHAAGSAEDDTRG